MTVDEPGPTTPLVLLALALEPITDQLRDLLDKYGAPVDAVDAPSSVEMEQLSKLIDKLDDWGGQLAPWLYQPRATREALHARYIAPQLDDDGDEEPGGGR